LSFSSMDVLSIHEQYTPPQPSESMVCLDSKTGNYLEEAGTDADADADADEATSTTNEALQFPQDIELTERSNDQCAAEASQPNVNLKPRKRKIRVEEKAVSSKKQAKDKASNSGNASSNAQKISQPTFSTSLSKARAFYDHLDATHELKIE